MKRKTMQQIIGFIIGLLGTYYLIHHFTSSYPAGLSVFELFCIFAGHFIVAAVIVLVGILCAVLWIK